MDNLTAIICFIVSGLVSASTTLFLTWYLARRRMFKELYDE